MAKVRIAGHDRRITVVVGREADKAVTENLHVPVRVVAGGSRTTPKRNWWAALMATMRLQADRGIR